MKSAACCFLEWAAWSWNPFFLLAILDAGQSAKRDNECHTGHHPRYSPSDSYHLLNRREQVTVFPLRTGHSRLRHHLHTKFGLGPNGECPCNTGHRTPDHILQACPNFNDLRARTWSTVTTLLTKLYGSPEDLRKTAAFVQETGVDMHMRRTRKKKKKKKKLHGEITHQYIDYKDMLPYVSTGAQRFNISPSITFIRLI